MTPNKVSPKDTDTYWWTCKNNHPSFQQSVSHRVTRKTKCPYCTGRKAVCGVNDLGTLYPEIAREWDPEKNNGVFPENVSPFTYNSFWWICPKGHSYKKKVIQRTKYHKPIDCPKCIKAHSTSFPEQAIFYYAKKCFPDAINRYKEPFDNGMELDIYIPFYKIGIEYDGLAFHNDEAQHDRERRKYWACKQQGIRLARIKESKDTWNDTLPSQIRPYSNKKYYWICPTCGKSYPAYPGNRVKGSGCPNCAHKKIGKSNSKTVLSFLVTQQKHEQHSQDPEPFCRFFHSAHLRFICFSKRNMPSASSPAQSFSSPLSGSQGSG